MFVAFIVTWQLLSMYHYLNPLVFSSPSAASYHLYLLLSGHGDLPDFFQSLWSTLVELTLAAALILAIGVPFGVLLGWNRFGQVTLMPLMIAFFSIPSIVLYPLIYLSFGLGITSKVIFGTIVGLFAVLENSSAGAKSIPAEYISISRSLGFSNFQLLRKIVLPSALPYITSGIRLGVSFALAGIIAGEYIASTTGLGELVVTALTLFRIDDMFAVILIVIGLGTLVNLLIILIERREQRYKRF